MRALAEVGAGGGNAVELAEFTFVVTREAPTTPTWCARLEAAAWVQ